MPTPLKIDFVSDVSCPWCAIGLASLDKALASLDGEVKAELHFQPFELNPQMAAEGEDIDEHIARKYGSTPAQSASNREAIRARGAAVGFTFGTASRRIYNTFDAHRLLHLAELEGHQAELKRALLTAYFTDNRNPSDHEVLQTVAESVGMDAERVRSLLASDEYADEVREREAWYQQRGIRAVPAVIVNDRHLIEGGQPAEVFEAALRRIAAETAG